jgi:hypothetical protein
MSNVKTIHINENTVRVSVSVIQGSVGGGGTGDVTGPVTSTDNAITRWNGTSGDTVQNSLVTIDDNGSINIPSSQAYKINGTALAASDVGASAVGHNHSGTYEPANANIQNHISSTSNPHSVTAAQVGLGSVTNNAQVKKVSSSTDNAVMRWDGATGDTPQDSLVTIADTTGAISINAHTAITDPGATPLGKFLRDDGTWQTVSGGGGTGDVVGPASSTDNAIARFDSTTGKLLQNSLVTVDDNGSVNIPSSQAYKINGTALAASDVGAEPANANIQNHISSTSNPHSVTYSQVGAEPANANIQNHISSTSNPHSVTATQVGLGNVTDNAQVKKISSSTDNAIIRWDGTTGDTPQNSLATVDDSGSINVPAGQGYQINGTALAASNVNAQALHGFVNRTDSVLGMSSNDLQVTTSGSYVFYVNGTKFTVSTTKAVTITADLDETFVYFDNTGTLQKSTTPWDIKDLTVIPVALVYKDGSNYQVYDERHTYIRSLPWHSWAHTTIGARYYGTGLAGTFTNTTLSITQGTIADEDLIHDTGGTKTTATLWYRSTGATAMRFEALQAYPYKQDTGTIQYDNAGTLTNVSTSQYVNSWVYAVPGKSSTTAEIAVVVGQAQYSSLTAAQSGSAPAFPGMSTLEWKLLYRVTYRNVAGTATYVEAVDYRAIQSGPAVSLNVTDHASLTNRDAVNSHPVTAISGMNSTLFFVINGGGSVPATGAYCLLPAPYACTIDSWYIAADASGSAVVDIKVGGSSIVGGSGNKPTLSSAQTNSANVSSWSDTSIAQNDLFTVNLDSVTTCKIIHVQLRVTRV